jgi:hypothetical protein
MPETISRFSSMDVKGVPCHVECAPAGAWCGLCRHGKTCAASKGSAYPPIDYLVRRFGDTAAKELGEKWQLP